ncbi:MAG TPA: RbsD/FucU domain-containing protein [Patescibacteria group bacterium]|nr:RbsD/FucU domain-containing protein [Patescibacteria group bacterium]
MLIGIPKMISPDLLKVLSEMGHGDEVVIADGNFPAAANARNLVRMDGHNVCDVLKAILELFPLDKQSPQCVSVMQTADGSKPPIWVEFNQLMEEKHYQIEFAEIERFEFYNKAQKAYCIIATTEPALYANVILKKGVL